MHVVVWLVEGTWQGCLKAAAPRIRDADRLTLLHVSPGAVGAAAGAAADALFGRTHRPQPAPVDWEQVEDQEAASLLARAAQVLGRPEAEKLLLKGRPEREVLQLADGADLLVLARDGDRVRLGPRSLGPATRFVVDHAPCDVLLVWPHDPPGLESIPAPEPHGRRPPHH